MLAIVVVLVLAAGGGMVYAIARGSGDAGVSVPPSSGVRAGGPQLVPVSRVVALATADARPIYWAGAPGPGSQLEFTKMTNTNVAIRYLFGGAAAGDPRPIFTTVATYGLAHAYRVIQADGSAKGASLVRIPGGGIAFTTSTAPSTYYIAFRDQNYVAKLYAESPQHARRLVLSGAIRPVAAARP